MGNLHEPIEVVVRTVPRLWCVGPRVTIDDVTHVRILGGVIASWLAAACGGASPADEDDTGSDTSGESTSGDATTTTTTTTPADASTTGVDPDTGEVTTSADDTTSGPPVDECVTDLSAGHHQFECDGLVYDVTVPEMCLDQPCGMIVDVHGYTMSAQMQEANTGLAALGMRHGYIVVQPNANPAPPAASWTPEIDDPKVFDFMQRVAAAWSVDPDRWHFTGFSQGGYMTWRFACAHADVLASVAPGAACGDEELFDDCTFAEGDAPSEPLDILYLHGTLDSLIGYGCAQPRLDAVVEHFGLGPAEMIDQAEGFRRIRHASDEMVIEHLGHDYSAESPIIRGHCFPGSTDPGGAPGQLFSFACVEDSPFVWGEEVIAFFDAHPRGK